MMGVRITCYDGVACIGGNKILLEDEERDSRVFLDFGMSFAQRGRFFEEYLNPRPGMGLRDPLRMRLLPPLAGIYRSDLVAALSPSDQRFMASSSLNRSLNINGVFLSHAHLDHAAYISFLREDVPVYTTAMTAFMAKAAQDVGQASDIEREVCYFSWREKDAESGLLKAVDRKDSRYGYLCRPFVLVDHPELIEDGFWRYSPGTTKSIKPCHCDAAHDKVGALPLRYFPVDHSIYGASACAIETSGGWVVYTGDLRLHGLKGDSTRAFVEEARKLKPVALLCEGTRIDDERTTTEVEVSEQALEVMKGVEGLAIADFAARNIERLIIFLQIAREVNRRMAIMPRDAYLLAAMRRVCDDIPDPVESEDIVVFADVKSQPGNWEKAIREKCDSKGRLVGAEEVGRNLGDYILAFSFYDINDLIDIEPQKATYIYSSSEAFNEEMKLDLKRLRNWLDHFNIEFIGNPLDKAHWQGLHASGHASGPDIAEIVDRIHPGVVIPIHTEGKKLRLFEERLKGRGINVCLPRVGQPIVVG